MQHPTHAHIAAALVSVPAAYALRHLADAAFVGGWSLGSMRLSEVTPGVYRGVSLFDGSAAHVDIRPEAPLGLIDYGVGTAEGRMPRIYVRVTPGATLGYRADECLVTLNALRAAGVDPERWARTCITHDAEILLIKAQLETAYVGDAS